MDDLTEEQRRQVYEKEKAKEAERRSKRTNRISMGCLAFIALFLIMVALIPVVLGAGRDATRGTGSGEALPTAPARVFPIPTRELEPAPSGPRSEFGDGAWLVGSEIAPGTYRTVSPSRSCYWARLAEFSNVKTFIERSSAATDAGVSSGGVAEAVVVVWIRASDAAFETKGCGIWRRVAESGS